MRKLTPLSIVLTAFLCACGGGGGGETVEAGGSVVASLRDNAAPADVCSNGGAQLDTGIDANHNGVLDGSEITNTQYVCNGGEGLATLVAITEEPSGGTCAAGGKKVAAGLDANANGILDQAEVASTGYICDGATGAPGVASLIKLTREAPGANCPTGGTKMESGPDSDRDGTLDDAEVTSSSYVCSAPHNASFTWEEARGEVRAQPNTGYIATGERLVTIVLPESPAFGDVVRVSGVGAGGWRIAQNEGQSIRTAPAIGVRWTARADVRNWASVASSADGSRLVAVSSDDLVPVGSPGQVFTSSDGGASWRAHELLGNWRSVASSADGARLIAAGWNEQLYTSTDGGETWTPRATAQTWRSVASSADGTRLVAAAYGGQVYTSTNGGVTWRAHELVREWASVASSADGSRLVAVAKGEPIHTSTDGGMTWSTHVQARDWISVASSADGSRLVAVADQDWIYTSTDGGMTWDAHELWASWVSVASSADGMRLIAVSSTGLLHISTDGGETWREGAAREWVTVACSEDGTRLIAAEHRGRLHISIPGNTSTPGNLGGILGHQFDAIELQYIGRETFLVLSSNGSLTVQ